MTKKCVTAIGAQLSILFTVVLHDLGNTDIKYAKSITSIIK